MIIDSLSTISDQIRWQLSQKHRCNDLNSTFDVNQSSQSINDNKWIWLLKITKHKNSATLKRSPTKPFNTCYDKRCAQLRHYLTKIFSIIHLFDRQPTNICSQKVSHEHSNEHRLAYIICSNFGKYSSNCWTKNSSKKCLLWHKWKYLKMNTSRKRTQICFERKANERNICVRRPSFWCQQSWVRETKSACWIT